MAQKKNVECYCYLFGTEHMVENRRKIVPKGIMPVYKTKEAACADIAVPDEVIVPAGKSVMVDLWIGFEIPKGYKIIMYPRSSLLIKKGLIQPVSIIDSDYSGQRVHAPLFNPTTQDIKLEAGERVAQIECVPVYDCTEWNHENTERASVNGGFGSTGAK